MAGSHSVISLIRLMTELKIHRKIEELDGILVNSKFGITGRVIDKVKSEFDLYKYLGLRRLGNLIKKYPQATFYFCLPMKN